MDQAKRPGRERQRSDDLGTCELRRRRDNDDDDDDDDGGGELLEVMFQRAMSMSIRISAFPWPRLRESSSVRDDAAEAERLFGCERTSVWAPVQGNLGSPPGASSMHTTVDGSAATTYFSFALEPSRKGRPSRDGTIGTRRSMEIEASRRRRGGRSVKPTRSEENECGSETQRTAVREDVKFGIWCERGGCAPWLLHVYSYVLPYSGT